MIYLVRHGQTEFNVAGRHHGWIDSPLTELGRDQARKTGQALAQLVGAERAAMFVSPLGRAVETAAIISQEAVFLPPATVDFDLREIGMGSAEGLTEREMARLWLEHQRITPGMHMSLEAPDGETLMEIGARLSRAFGRIAGSPAAVKVVVSHGVAGRVLQALYLGKSPQSAVDFAAPHDAMFQLNAGCIRRLELTEQKMSASRVIYVRNSLTCNFE
jgi:broad specificity phosphatase PhoE